MTIITFPREPISFLNEAVSAVNLHNTDFE
jgi:hypothetical protein